jgi:hypothetical protein
MAVPSQLVHADTRAGCDARMCGSIWRRWAATDAFCTGSIRIFLTAMVEECLLMSGSSTGPASGPSGYHSTSASSSFDARCTGNKTGWEGRAISKPLNGMHICRSAFGMDGPQTCRVVDFLPSVRSSRPIKIARSWLSKEFLLGLPVPYETWHVPCEVVLSRHLRTPSKLREGETKPPPPGLGWPSVVRGWASEWRLHLSHTI